MIQIWETLNTRKMKATLYDEKIEDTLYGTR